MDQSTLGSVLKYTWNQQLADQLHKKKEKPILHLKTIFRLLIQLICNW